MKQDGVSNNKSVKKSRSKRQKYSKISLKSKIIFYQKVIHEQADLRQISKKLGIKYSTAKTLVRNYKTLPEEANEDLVRTICDDFDCKFKAKRRCAYRLIDQRTQASESSVKQQNLTSYIRPGKIEIVCSMASCEQR